MVFILESIKEDYRVLQIKDDRIMSYSSLYFDTQENKFYNDHHNGKNNRTKIRQRKYIESDLCFLEIKQKNGKGETNKSRIQVNDFEIVLTNPSKDFISKTTKDVLFRLRNKDARWKTYFSQSFDFTCLLNKKWSGEVLESIDLGIAVILVFAFF